MSWPPSLLTSGPRKTTTRRCGQICLGYERKTPLFFADLIDLSLQRQFIQSCQRQREKQADSTVQHHESVVESPFDFFVCALHSSGIGNPPMRCHGLPGPDWAYFGSGVIADREYKIKMRSVWCGKFFPALAAVTVRGQARLFKLPQCCGMHRALRLAAGTVGGKTGPPLEVENCFRHDGSSGVAGAKEQNVVPPAH